METGKKNRSLSPVIIWGILLFAVYGCGGGGGGLLEKTSDHIVVIYPAGGITLTRGSSVQISWAASSSVSNCVDILLFSSPGSLVATIASNYRFRADSSTSTGNYTWTVPSNLPLTANYFIRVKDHSVDLYFGDSGPFYLGTSTTTRVLTSITLALTSLNLQAGESYNLSSMRIIANYSDGTTAEVSTSVTWEKLSGAGLVSGFTFTAPSIQDTCVIQASYTENTITKTATLTVNVRGSNEGSPGATWTLNCASVEGADNSMKAVSFNGKTYLLGNSVLYSMNGAEWTTVTTNPPFKGRNSHMVCTGNGRIWVMGGSSSREENLHTLLNDVYCSTDGLNWLLVSANAPWKPRRNGAAAYFRNKLWLVGGYASRDGSGQAENIADIWASSDGTDWTEIPNAPFPPREGHTLTVYASKMWLIGGINYLRRQDVWSTADGINWISVTEAAAFGPRCGHAAVSAEGRLWVMGGLDLAGYIRSDVWSTTDGENWLLSTSNASFGTRYDHSAVRTGDRIFVLSGFGASTGVSVYSCGPVAVED